MSTENGENKLTEIGSAVVTHTHTGQSYTDTNAADRTAVMHDNTTNIKNRDIITACHTDTNTVREVSSLC